MTHSLMLVRGMTENLTVTASAEFSVYEREAPSSPPSPCTNYYPR